VFFVSVPASNLSGDHAGDVEAVETAWIKAG
jgi:hypothetical protein